MRGTLAARRRTAKQFHQAPHPAPALCEFIAQCVGGATERHEWRECVLCHKHMLVPEYDLEEEALQGSGGVEHSGLDCNTTCQSCSRETPKEGVSARPLPPPFITLTLPSETPPSTEVLDDLGISASTFRKLRGLQAREIEPEDYDLLLRLHAKPTTRVLKDDLREKVCLSFRAGGDGKEWVQPADPCTICLCVMAAGEDLTQLTCQGQHVFHSHCIREWLQTASCRCPVDKQDLSMICLSA